MLAATEILIVDDRADSLLALACSLRRDQVVILQARSGAEALEMLLAHDVALAILDVQMPEMNGFELAELMRGAERTRHIPIIFLTAGAHDQDRVFRAYQTGAVDILCKPYDPRILSSKVDVFVELDRKRREVDETLRFSQLFVGMLGHDLRNPLSAITSGAYLLKNGAAQQPKQAAVAGRVLTSARRMARMIEDILDFTRLRIGDGLPLTICEHDVTTLISTIVEELRLADGAPPIVVESSGDARVACDAERLFQVLSNLLGNAVQHGTPGEPIHLRLDGAPAGELSFTISNRGSIPSELLPCIFDPFRRSSVLKEGSRSGLGLGLYISQQIVAAHGGSLDVESNEQTVFKVRLPRRRAAAFKTAPATRNTMDVAPLLMQGRGK